MPAAYLAMTLLPLIVLLARHCWQFVDLGELAAAVTLAILANDRRVRHAGDSS